MKVIKVGRSSENDIVIQNDAYVGRTHCEFIQDDSGNCWVVDMNSKNGTFVNGVRRSGKTKLSSNDMVRIGNTMLPWRNYFQPAERVPGTVVKIGRNPDNDIRIDDNNASRFHCRILCNEDGTYILEDLKSKNGTFVNGLRINRRITLRHGDKIRVGNTHPSWEDYIPKAGGDATGTEIGTDVGTGTGTGIGSDKTREISGIWTLLIGLASFGCMAYIVVNYFTSFGHQLVSAFGGAAASIKLFPIYLRGYFGIGGQWMPMIVGVVLGLLTDLVDFLAGEKEDKLASVGRWLGNAGAVMGGIFIVLAIFAEKIVAVL